ncbi:MAG: cell division protease FtsH [Actinomycetota bacterium]|jgi:ATP-dependent Zn protease|nr:cell division protease FtsH [Actinomycetota bacterium]
MDLKSLGGNEVFGGAGGDVARSREQSRQRRLARITLAASLVCLWMWLRLLRGKSILPGLPHLTGVLGQTAPLFLLVVILGGALFVPMLTAGRSPHVLFRSSEITTSFADVKGIPVVVEEVIRTLNLFLAFKTFQDRMGGTPRRAVLFEGPPGTGKTYMAKAMAREAGVPFLFVSSSAFQSMYYGQTNRKIRSYFKSLRKAARREGGAIGFIEEIDAVGAARSGMGSSTAREGISGVVNELLIQLQSFDTPPAGTRLRNALVEVVNSLLPSRFAIAKRTTVPANILVIGATNRAADLDPALLRPGRFDRSIYFDLPSRTGRREIIDYYLAKKTHDPELDDPARRDTMAAMTSGYTPVMIEHLLDEALVWALRRGAEGLGWADVQRAKMTEEIGLAQPVEYTEAERRTIATHESGHATVAWLVGKSRKLEVLSIVKRKDALGLLAHSDLEERFLKSESELHGLIQIALGGLVAEEVFFGEISSGPAGDLHAATTWAAQMVGSFGMGGSLFSYEAMRMPEANIVSRVASTDEGKATIEAMLDEARREVRTMLDAHLPVVERLRDALLERNELIGDEILDVIQQAAPGREPSPAPGPATTG